MDRWDYLRAHPEWVEKLSAHKVALCRQFNNHRQAYIDGKAEMVREITALALAYGEGNRPPLRRQSNARGMSMASHLSDIGFPTADQDEVVQLAVRAAESGTRHSTSHGDYVVWSPGGGAELWVHVAGENRITQLHPHYAGTETMLCGVTELLRDPEYPLEGSVSGWACVTPGNPAAGVYPFTANIPDFCRYFTDPVLPLTVSLQVTAFAQQVLYFPDDATFDSQKELYRTHPGFRVFLPEKSKTDTGWLKKATGWLCRLPKALSILVHRRANLTALLEPCAKFSLAAESYVPMGGPAGLFNDVGTNKRPDAESVLMSGHILTSQRHRNPETGNEFFVLTLRVQEGTFTVVADAHLFEDNTLTPGGILQGTFWLSARVAEWSTDRR